MNKDVVRRLLSIVSNKNNGCITFDKEFKDNSAWSAAFMHNISTKVFDYNAEYELFKKNFPNEDKFETDENNVVTKICRDVPLMQLQRKVKVEKFFGGVNHKEDNPNPLVITDIPKKFINEMKETACEVKDFVKKEINDTFK